MKVIAKKFKKSVAWVSKNIRYFESKGYTKAFKKKKT